MVVNVIIPGCWISTRQGPAVCISVESHDHSLVERHPEPGHTICACESDACKDAVYVSFRYKAQKCIHDAEGKVNGFEKDPIWVWDGDTSDKVSFTGSPTRLSKRVLKLTGPYGRG